MQGAQPGYDQKPGQMPPGYQQVPQYPPAGYPPAGYPPAGYPPAGYPPAGYPAQAAVGYGQPGQPGQPAVPATFVQPSYAAGAQQQPYPPPVGPGDVNVQLPPNGTASVVLMCNIIF